MKLFSGFTNLEKENAVLRGENALLRKQVAEWNAKHAEALYLLQKSEQMFREFRDKVDISDLLRSTNDQQKINKLQEEISKKQELAQPFKELLEEKFGIVWEDYYSNELREGITPSSILLQELDNLNASMEQKQKLIDLLEKRTKTTL